MGELAKKWGEKKALHPTLVRRYLRECALWGHVTETAGRYTITPTQETLTLEVFKRQIHAEIVRRRKEARDGYHAWRPDNVHTLNQSALLDWLEDELCLRPAKGAKA
jgi:hypothetical protein